MEYQTVAAAQTDAPLGGATSNVGDYLERLICVVSTAATSAVSIKDGSGSSITVLPNNVGGGIGTYPINMNLTSRSGKLTVTTGAGVAVIAVGRFKN